MPSLRALHVTITDSFPDDILAFPRGLAVCASREFSFSVFGDADPEAASVVFCALCALLADILLVCCIRLQDASALRLSPLAGFPNLRMVTLGIEPDSVDVLYRWCDEMALLPHLKQLIVWHQSSIGDVHEGEGIDADVVDIAEVLRRSPSTLESGCFAGWTVRIHMSQFSFIFAANRVPPNVRQVWFSASLTGRTLATYILTFRGATREWTWATARVSLPLFVPTTRQADVSLAQQTDLFATSATTPASQKERLKECGRHMQELDTTCASGRVGGPVDRHKVYRPAFRTLAA